MAFGCPRVPFEGLASGLPMPGKFHPVILPKFEPLVPGSGAAAIGLCGDVGDSGADRSNILVRRLGGCVFLNANR
jgi:hypothetical protein